MLSGKNAVKTVSMLVALLILSVMLAACAVPKEPIKFHDGQWETLWEHNHIAGYIVEHGYNHPVQYIQGSTGTMLVALPEGDLDINMELWRNNIQDWYNENVSNGKLVDLAGTANNVPNGSKGQILETSTQGFYIPTYVAEANPGLKSVSDLPDYANLFPDPENTSKGVIFNCILGWACQKIVRAKWHAYGLYDTYNVMEPGSAAALDAGITGAYLANEPVLSYYWEPTKIINDLDMTRLEEPEWTQECQDALNVAVESEPYESTMGCAFPAYDIHTGINSGLVERAPEVVEFLSNMFVGALPLGDLAAHKASSNMEWDEAAIYWLRNNEFTWTTWVPSDVVTKVKKALAEED